MSLTQRLAAAGALGLVLGFGSEMLFWSAPPEGTTFPDIAMTLLAYMVAAWAGLAAAACAGTRSWPGLMLAGAVFGWLIEGVVVDTVTSALPWTIVFTAMSWHALVSVIGVFALVRLSAAWRIGRQIALLAGLGLFFGLWAQFWPLERGAMPPDAVTWAYLMGLGALVPLANHLLDALPRRFACSRREALALGGLFALGWGARLVLSGNLALLVLPVLILPTLWIMRRTGAGGGHVDLPPRPDAPLRHWLFLIVPTLTALIATQGWRLLGGVATNVPLAILLSGAALWLYGLAVMRLFTGAREGHIEEQ